MNNMHQQNQSYNMWHTSIYNEHDTVWILTCKTNTTLKDIIVGLSRFEGCEEDTGWSSSGCPTNITSSMVSWNLLPQSLVFTAIKLDRTLSENLK